MKQIFLVLAPICLLLSGCAGYSLSGQKPAHLRTITKIAVPTSVVVLLHATNPVSDPPVFPPKLYSPPVQS
jgi:hypothetical protein